MTGEKIGLKHQHDINVTPLVDVLLVLLIIFMVIMPLVQKGLDTQVPPRADKPGESRAIVLQIGPSGELAINKQTVEFAALGDRLSAIFTTRGTDRTLFVDADDKVPYETVVRALDVARGPGRVQTIGFVVN